MVSTAMTFRLIHVFLTVAMISTASIPIAEAGPLREILRRRGATEDASDSVEGSEAGDIPAAAAHAGARRITDVSYGSDPHQRLDVYLPASPSGGPAPVILMVHGGGWRLGDKAMTRVVENKVARWVPRGFVFVSINYRLLPQADVLQQADDVARAVAYVQQHAAMWMADGGRVILMGHSAGAHLVALLTSAPGLGANAGVKPWLGSVLLDSAALDVPTIMQHKHYRLYDQAFGKNPAFWNACSPRQQLARGAEPMLAICSSQRADSQAQSHAFAQHAAELGARVTVHEEDLTHREINERLGLPGAYTHAVEAFMASLDPGVASRLTER